MTCKSKRQKLNIPLHCKNIAELVQNKTDKKDAFKKVKN